MPVFRDFLKWLRQNTSAALMSRKDFCFALLTPTVRAKATEEWRAMPHLWPAIHVKKGRWVSCELAPAAVSPAPNSSWLYALM